MEDLTLWQLVALHQLMRKVNDEGWLRNKLDLIDAFLTENNTKEAYKVVDLLNKELK